MKRYLPLIAILLVMLAACSPAAAPETDVSEANAPDAPAQEAAGAGAAKQTAPVLVREAYPNYAASFVVDFDGAAKWKYQLKIRKSPKLVETNLHIEGVSGSVNPGDIRLVTDGVTSWMIGPGTDNECVQFPNGSGMDPNLIYPESLIPLKRLPGLAKQVREEPFAGKTSQYHTGGPVNVGSWKDARLEYRNEKDSPALLQFAMLATGKDPVFGGGEGTLMATYTIDSIDPQAIEPVSGCEISVPLPASARQYVRLPGLSAFESVEETAQMITYYQGQLAQAGWSEHEPLAQAGEVTILSYQRGAEQVEVHIEAGDEGGSLVKLLFLH